MSKPPLPLPWILMSPSIVEYTEDPSDRFARQMRVLVRAGLRGASVRDVLASPRARRRRMVALTSDDGYADFLSHSLPILERHGFGATLFWPSARRGPMALPRTYVGERDGALRLAAKRARSSLRTRRARR